MDLSGTAGIPSGKFYSAWERYAVEMPDWDELCLRTTLLVLAKLAITATWDATSGEWGMSANRIRTLATWRALS